MPVPVADSFDDSLSVPEDGKGSLDPLKCQLQGFGQFGPFGGKVLLLEGGYWLVGVSVESRERGVGWVESEIKMVNKNLKKGHTG